MQTTVTINGDQATVDITHTSDLAKVQETLEAAAKYAFNHGYFTAPDGVDPASIIFDDLTNNQKLVIFTDFVKASILSAAQAQHIEDAVDAARTTAYIEAGNIFI